ncbi:MAG: hypothetical protein MEQ74_04000 [Paracoccus sp.]|nr:hypothetical protein [Paracoccus sp. (in: a-proteobacteria)]
MIPALPVQTARKALLGHRGRKANQDLQARQDRRVNPAPRAPTAQMERRENKDLLAPQDRPARRGTLAHPVPTAILDHKARPGLRDRGAILGRREQPARVASR